MNRFKGIFNKRPGTKAAPTDSSASPLDFPVDDLVDDLLLDDTLRALSFELSGLAQMQSPPAAKERGWSRLALELERRPVRTAGKTVNVKSGAWGATRGGRPALSPTYSRTRRWALGSAAVAVAIIAVLLGTYGGGLLQSEDSEQPSPVASVAGPDGTEPVTTVSGDNTNPGTNPGTTGDSGSTGAVPGTTLGPDSTGTTNASPGSTGPATTGSGSTSGSVGPSTTGGSGGPTTTKAPSPTTTRGQIYTTGEREGSAKAVAIYLADLVITGNTSGARALVASEAQSSLAQMMLSLNEPYGYRVTGVQLLTSDTVRVTMDLNDRVTNGQGQLVDVLKHYVVKVRVNSDGAVVIAINAGS